MPVELDHEPGLGPQQVDAGDAAAGFAQPDLATRSGQAGLADEAERRLLEPALAERKALRTVEQAGQAGGTRPTDVAELV